jgi:8-oxo-dGTP pyrophosphatase MutT (NUDIX family)
MIYFDTNEPPPHFSPAWEVSGCFCTCQNKVLLLKRHPSKPQGNTWSLPAGKLEIGETPLQALIMELYEEIGILLDETNIQYVNTLYARIPETDYTFHMFHTHFTTFPSLLLARKENSDYIWCNHEEALQLPLIIGGKEALEVYENQVWPAIPRK